MASHIERALAEAKDHVPGWVWAVLAKAVAGDGAVAGADVQVDDLYAVWLWGQDRLPLQVGPLGGVSKATREASTLPALLAAARWALDSEATEGVRVVGKDGASASVAGELALPQVLPILATHAPDAVPDVAFVALHPTALDVARGEPLCGPDGRAFADRYLAPLGMSKADVMVTHIAPVATGNEAEAIAQWAGWARGELDRCKPRLVVALGKAAKDHLQQRADFVLPHPAAVRKHQNDGEVVRKLRRIRERLATMKGQRRNVHIGKADDSKHIVYGVVLDAYQIDTQDDWVPAWEVEQTAHDYLEKSRQVNLQHEGAADATVVESWLWPYPSDGDYKAAMRNAPHTIYESKFGEDKVHSGSWVMGVRIDDQATWEAVEAGEITAFSIGGSGVRTPMDPQTTMPQIKVITQQ